MPSFDIVSEIDQVEVRNAVDNANRELDTRFDFRGVEASFELKDGHVTMTAESDFQLQQMLDILRTKCAKRGVDNASLEEKDIEHIGKTYKQVLVFQQGIDQPMAKKIIKLLKESKVKVQSAIQGEQIRVSGKKRDDLQQAIALVKEANLGQPFQFNNFRD
ncbi:YajQ family cyclic di-GMP-binding protein [Lacimicrobium alkaliphilum]|uniref:Nucleotide-binding protein AT746_19020 n=1 Tax=Lacimicrobium alkaliphilum TaxID=1526571 RepID=A0A0U2ZMC7_9ALTE|nr:YajQ family cyclic di-GMP-binding protein [Lacimicrobium alkaliphilum]ALT00152.1 nucleotide-binding protein [Lacimicrobium alkaliphilum]